MRNVRWAASKHTTEYEITEHLNGIWLSLCIVQCVHYTYENVCFQVLSISSCPFSVNICFISCMQLTLTEIAKT